MVMRRSVGRTVVDLMNWAENLPGALRRAHRPVPGGGGFVHAGDFLDDGGYGVQADQPDRTGRRDSWGANRTHRSGSRTNGNR